MFFREVTGQSVVKQKLILGMEQQQVPHAQLFLGPEGNGGLALALAYAQYLQCEKRTAGDSCGVCSSCIRSQKLMHPDVHFTFPVFKKKPGSENPALSQDFIREWREAVPAHPYLNLNDWLEHIHAENKQGNISAEECRAIHHRLSLKTFEGPYKIQVIWMAELLGKEGNILLKLLEEPPPGTVMLLVAENREMVLPTILSRCQVLPVPRLGDDDLLDTLLQHTGRESAQQIVRHAEGNYREALQLLNHEESNHTAFLVRWLQLLYSAQYSDLVKWVEEAARLGRENQKQFLRYALEFTRECLILKYAGPSHSHILGAEKKLADWLSGRLEDEDWKKLQTALEQAHYHVERNAHAKILFMHLSLQLQTLVVSKKVSLTTS